jgi:hypothetical protein
MGSGVPVVVATKFAPWPLQLRRGALVQALRASLARLGLDRIDLYQIHFPFSVVPVPVWANALADAMEAGLTRSVGVSNYSAARMRQAHEVLSRRGIPLASNQVQYHLLNRSMPRRYLTGSPMWGRWTPPGQWVSYGDAPAAHERDAQGAEIVRTDRFDETERLLGGVGGRPALDCEWRAEALPGVRGDVHYGGRFDPGQGLRTLDQILGECSSLVRQRVRSLVRICDNQPVTRQKYAMSGHMRRKQERHTGKPDW